MGHVDELWRYDGRRVVVTGCASGIGADVARQLAELGAEVIGLDIRQPAVKVSEFISLDLSDSASIDGAAASRWVRAAGRSNTSRTVLMMAV